MMTDREEKEEVATAVTGLDSLSSRDWFEDTSGVGRAISILEGHVVKTIGLASDGKP